MALVFRFATVNRVLTFINSYLRRIHNSQGLLAKYHQQQGAMGSYMSTQIHAYRELLRRQSRLIGHPIKYHTSDPNMEFSKIKDRR